MPILLEALIAVCILIGAAFTFIGSLGLARLPDFYMRLHGPTKATTLGVGSILIASVIYQTAKTNVFSVHEVLVTVFLFITTPVSAHMVVKAAMHLKVKRIPETLNEPWTDQPPPEKARHQE